MFIGVARIHTSPKTLASDFTQLDPIIFVHQAVRHLILLLGDKRVVDGCVPLWFGLGGQLGMLLLLAVAAAVAVAMMRCSVVVQ